MILLQILDSSQGDFVHLMKKQLKRHFKKQTNIQTHEIEENIYH